VAAYAFCADPPAGLQLATAGTSPRSSTSPRSVHATCPPGTKVVGNGFSITDGIWDPGEVALAHLVADDTAAYARAYELDPTSATWYLTVHAICANPLPGLQRVTASSGFNQMEGKSVTAFCPGGKRATGLGATSSLGHRGVIDDLQPSDAPTTTGTRPPTSGKATGHVDENADLLDWWVASYVSCADASFTLQPA
jgi:hypothetical protein